MNWKFYTILVLLVTDIHHEKEEPKEIRISKWDKFQFSVKVDLGEEQSEKITEIIKFLITRATRRWEQIHSFSRWYIYRVSQKKGINIYNNTFMLSAALVWNTHKMKTGMCLSLYWANETQAVSVTKIWIIKREGSLRWITVEVWECLRRCSWDGAASATAECRTSQCCETIK